MALSFRRGPRGTPDGVMPLAAHLRELRRRLFIAVLSIFVGTVIGWFLFDPIFELLKAPYVDGIAPLLADEGVDVRLVLSGGVGTAFSFRLKLALVIGIVLSCPVWIGQLWGFILPALHRNERRWTLLLTATGVPLFVGGICVGYLVLPKGIEVLIGFVPDSVEMLTTLGDYLNFVLRTLLVFGVAAEIPLVVILLNRLGIVSARRLRSARPWTIIGIFVFAAIATPSTDPLTMLFLAVPMTLLYALAEVIASLTDHRRHRDAPAALGDDETSPLDPPGDAP